MKHSIGVCTILILVLAPVSLQAQSSTCPGSTQLGAATSSAGIGGGFGGRGSIRQYTGSGSVLTSFSQELFPVTQSEMTFQVFEGTTATGPWMLKDSSVVPAQGPGRAEYDSGALSVPLITGRYYAIIAYNSIGPTTTYYFSTVSPMVYADWTYGSRIYENAYPPGTFIISGTADCHQWLCSGGLVVDQVDTAPTSVFGGQTGIVVTVTVTSVSPATINSLAGTLSFTGTADRTSEYTVTPNPANPTTIVAGSTVMLDFMVDVSSMPTAETITLDAAVTGFDTGLGSAIAASGAAITDTWDVLAGGLSIDLIDAPDASVVAGLGGYPVSVTLANLGANPLLLGATTLSFTGTADRTSEYTVVADPTNPTSIAAFGSEVLDFSVDVAASATRETVTIDAASSGADSITGAVFNPMAAVVTDSWVVSGCSAPLCGDCSGDLVINIVDALIAAQHGVTLITLTGIDFTNCNVVGTVEPFAGAIVDIIDALTLAQFSAGLPVVLACCV